jgi:hypothetical protein
MEVFHALWHMDTRNLHDMNMVLMVLRPKSPEAAAIKDDCLIALIHLIGTLIAKVVANHLAP